MEGSGTCHGAASWAPRLVRAGEGVGPSARLSGALLTSPRAGLARIALKVSRPRPGSRGRCSPSARAAGPVPGLVAAAPTWWSEACSDLGLEAGRAGSEQESGDSLPWARWAGRWWRGLGIYTRPGGWQGGIQCHQPGGSVLISVPLLARLRLSALPVFVICLCVSPRASGLLSL